jgi:hypothetical protein
MTKNCMGCGADLMDEKENPRTFGWGLMSMCEPCRRYIGRQPDPYWNGERKRSYAEAYKIVRGIDS